MRGWLRSSSLTVVIAVLAALVATTGTAVAVTASEVHVMNAKTDPVPVALVRAVPFTVGTYFNLAAGASTCVSLLAPGSMPTFTSVSLQSNGTRGHGYATFYVPSQGTSQPTVGALRPFNYGSGFMSFETQMTTTDNYGRLCVWNDDTSAAHSFEVSMSGTSTPA